MTSYLEKAYGVLREAEHALRTLMKEGIELQRYGEVATIAGVAERLASAIRDGGDTQEALGRGEEESVTRHRSRAASSSIRSRDRGARRTAPRKSQGTRGYPEFKKDGDDLIKVGWSRKRRREYIQRASRKIVWALATTLEELYAGRRFTMAKLLPSVEERHGKIPSYQVYAAHAWLKSIGAVFGNGRLGYRGDSSKLSLHSLDEFWQALPEIDRNLSKSGDEKDSHDQ